MGEYYKRDSCRLCGSKNIALALDLGKSPLCDAYVNHKKDQHFYDLDLYRCAECGFVQLGTVIDPEIIYRDYIYVTTSSSGLVRHFEEYCKDVNDSLGLKSGLVVDIGSNEGTLLNFFKDRGLSVLGVEPSLKASSIANSKGILTIPEFFDKKLALDIIDRHGHASLVTINNLFANIDNLYDFTDAVETLLDKNGVLVIESSYLFDMIDNMVFDFIYHEHLSYFSALPLMAFFGQFNMNLIRAQRIPTKGGSVRYFFAKDKSKWNADDSVELICEEERKRPVNEELFGKYLHNIQFLKNTLMGFLEINKNKNIVGYGASATSTTLISYFGMSEYLEYLVDDNKAKQNTFSPGYNIPVHSPSILKSDSVDIIIVLAWRFYDEIIKKIDNINTVIVVPLPQFLVVKNGA